MKTETFEKTRHIFEVLFILFSSILIMLTAFRTLPVHAEEVNQYIYDFTWSEDSSGSWVSRFSGEYQIHSNIEIAFVKNGFSRTFVSGYSGEEVTKHGYYLVYLTADKQDVKGTKSLYYSGSFSRYEGSKLYDTKTYNYGDSNAYMIAYSLYYSNFNETSSGFYNEIETTAKIFNSVDSAIKYVENGDTSGIINGGSIDNPDFEDTAYAFTGFTANNKMTATWTGTTERSYLKDQDVEEYTTFTYGFASSEDQTVSSFTEYDGEYATADKKLKLPWDEMDAKKKDGEFIRQVNITPCYRVPGAFYRGVSAKVYFHKDGSIDKIVRDFPQSTGDYSYKHIFSSDKYSTDIPAPELSAVSHNGFTLLNNSDNQYYVDIILESSFYGVKMEKDAGTWLPVVDTDWVYNKHYYNFADTSQIAINNDVVYIPNLYSVNPENELITDFKNWSSDYPTYSKLPTMSFLKRGTPARVKYEDQFLYKENSKYTDSEQIRFSHQAESVFYVRYYNKSMVYGPWVRYKFRDAESVEVPGGNLGGAIIDVGQVDVDEDGNVKVDENGNPVVSDNVHGRQDYNTGESNFNDGSFSLSLSDVNSFFDYIQEIFKSITGSLSSFGSLVAACFGFLPSKLINAIIFGIVLMMFIGLIKVVKG